MVVRLSGRRIGLSGRPADPCGGTVGRSAEGIGGRPGPDGRRRPGVEPQRRDRAATARVAQHPAQQTGRVCRPLAVSPGRRALCGAAQPPFGRGDRGGRGVAGVDGGQHRVAQHAQRYRGQHPRRRAGGLLQRGAPYLLPVVPGPLAGRHVPRERRGVGVQLGAGKERAPGIGAFVEAVSRRRLEQDLFGVGERSQRGELVAQYRRPVRPGQGGAQEIRAVRRVERGERVEPGPPAEAARGDPGFDEAAPCGGEEQGEQRVGGDVEPVGAVPADAAGARLGRFGQFGEFLGGEGAQCPQPGPRQRPGRQPEGGRPLRPAAAGGVGAVAVGTGRGSPEDRQHLPRLAEQCHRAAAVDQRGRSFEEQQPGVGVAFGHNSGNSRWRWASRRRPWSSRAR